MEILNGDTQWGYSMGILNRDTQWGILNGDTQWGILNGDTRWEHSMVILDRNTRWGDTQWRCSMRGATLGPRTIRQHTRCPAELRTGGRCVIFLSGLGLAVLRRCRHHTTTRGGTPPHNGSTAPTRCRSPVHPRHPRHRISGRRQRGGRTHRQFDSGWGQ